MDSNNQRLVLALGAGAAVLAGVIFAIVALGKPAKPASHEASPQVQVSMKDAAPNLDPAAKVPCFVDGKPAGNFTVAECAKKNGVDVKAMDLGLDDTGAWVAVPTASNAPPPALPPLTPQAGPAVAPVAGAPAARPTEAVPAPAGGGDRAACLRFTGSEWRQVTDNVTQGACIQALFAGRCVRAGEAEYGRWGTTTLRLVPGKVEQAPDNKTFRTVAEQRRGCDNAPTH